VRLAGLTLNWGKRKSAVSRAGSGTAGRRRCCAPCRCALNLDSQQEVTSTMPPAAANRARVQRPRFPRPPRRAGRHPAIDTPSLRQNYLQWSEPPPSPNGSRGLLIRERGLHKKHAGQPNSLSPVMWDMTPASATVDGTVNTLVSTAPQIASTGELQYLAIGYNE
jgi:hypothetical protein